MNLDYPTPWNFSNTDENMLSPNRKYKIEFGSLWEIAMGAPLGGQCYLIFNDKRIKLNDWAGGPIAWNNTSNKVALPIWTKNRFQKISIVDIDNFTITTFKKVFNVLYFHKFDNNILYFMDSPTYRKIKVNFDINKEEIETVIPLI